jgi:hypothetical protein
MGHPHLKRKELNMGLDMYLLSNKRKEIGYWRKANQIHGFFERELKKCDNARNNPVPEYVLEKLLDACIRVKDSLVASGTKPKEMVVSFGYENGKRFVNKDYLPVYINTKLAEKLLPTEEGFFFGSTEYTEDYLQDINDTIEILTTALANKVKGERFYYHPWY